MLFCPPKFCPSVIWPLVFCSSVICPLVMYMYILCNLCSCTLSHLDLSCYLSSGDLSVLFALSDMYYCVVIRPHWICYFVICPLVTRPPATCPTVIILLSSAFQCVLPFCNPFSIYLSSCDLSFCGLSSNDLFSCGCDLVILLVLLRSSFCNMSGIYDFLLRSPVIVILPCSIRLCSVVLCSILLCPFLCPTVICPPVLCCLTYTPVPCPLSSFDVSFCALSSYSLCFCVLSSVLLWYVLLWSIFRCSCIPQCPVSCRPVIYLLLLYTPVSCPRFSCDLSSCDPTTP